jgi:hypothetical protein
MIKNIQPYPKYSHIPKQFKPRIPQQNPTYHRAPLHIPNNSYMSQHKTAYTKIFFHPILMSLIVQYTSKKWLPFEIIYAYMSTKVPSIFFQPYQILLTSYVQYRWNPAVKKWLPFELICAVSDRAHFGYGRTQGLSK